MADVLAGCVNQFHEGEMFSILRRREPKRNGSFPIGGAEYRQFRELSQKPHLVDYLVSVCSGMSHVPLGVKDDVQRMIGLAQSLISMSGLGLADLVRCAKSNNWISLEERLDRIGSAVTAMVDKARTSLERLRAWADENRLPHLTSFESSAYQMTGFPREIPAILTLRQLHLPDAGLTAVPGELASLPMLEAICLDRNNVTSLPSGIFRLPSLTRIDAEGNAIEEVPDSIGEARHLQSLDLDGNNLRSISPQIARCKSLTRLYLRKQRHGISLESPSTPITDDAVRALASLEYDGVDVRF